MSTTLEIQDLCAQITDLLAPTQAPEHNPPQHDILAGLRQKEVQLVDEIETCKGLFQSTIKQTQDLQTAVRDNEVKYRECLESLRQNPKLGNRTLTFLRSFTQPVMSNGSTAECLVLCRTFVEFKNLHANRQADDLALILMLDLLRDRGAKLIQLNSNLVALQQVIAHLVH
jgi:hypothetical protein